MVSRSFDRLFCLNFAIVKNNEMMTFAFGCDSD